MSENSQEENEATEGRKSESSEKKRSGRTTSKKSVAERESLEQELNHVRDEVEQLRERWMRAAAELENFKKRSAREREDYTRYANEALLRQILPILDNLQRALNHDDDQKNCQGLWQGIEMIYRQFVTILENCGVKPIDSVDKPFDPSVHEAMMQVDSEEHEPNTVIQETEKGYLLHDRLLRPARVVVSKRTES